MGKVLLLVLLGALGFCKGSVLSRIFWKSSNWQVQQHQQQKHRQEDSQPQNSKGFGRWRKKLLFLGVSVGVMVSVWLFLSMNASIISRRKENLATMCDERARMLQDQFNVSMNHVNALAILVSTFHHGKDPSAIDQVLHCILMLFFSPVECKFYLNTCLVRRCFCALHLESTLTLTTPG